MSIDFFNKVKSKLGNLFTDFLKRITFWDISKWNRGLPIWDEGSIKLTSDWSPKKKTRLKKLFSCLHEFLFSSLNFKKFSFCS
jgi:hypothetical protein